MPRHIQVAYSLPYIGDVSLLSAVWDTPGDVTERAHIAIPICGDEPWWHYLRWAGDFVPLEVQVALQHTWATVLEAKYPDAKGDD